MSIESGKWLDCGCCGLAFKTWEGYVDQDQDLDYGICQECQGEAEDRSDGYIMQGVKLLIDNLKGDQLKSFESKNLEQQKLIAMRCLNENLLTWGISK